MSIKQAANDAGAVRLPSLRIPYDGSAHVDFLVDAGQDPRHVRLHDLGKKGKRQCQGEGCALCAAAGAPDESWIVTVDLIDPDNGTTAARALWLRRRELGELAAALPDTGGTVELRAQYLPRQDGELRDDGKPWLDLAFWCASGEGAA